MLLSPRDKEEKITGASIKSIIMCGLTTGTSKTSASQHQNHSVSSNVIYATNTNSLLEVESGRIDNETYADVFMVGKGFNIINTYNYDCKVVGFMDEVGLIRLHVVDAVVVARTGDENEVIIRINQAVSNPNEEQSLL